MKSIAIVLCVVCLSASAGTPADVAPSNYFGCDAPENRYAQWTRELLSVPVTITGTFELIERKSHSTASSIASVLVRSANEQSSSGFRVGWPKSKKDGPFLELLTAGQTDRPRYLVNASGRVAFSISIDASGAALFRIGEASHKVTFDVRNPMRLILGCSTVEVDFDAVKVYEVTPNNSLQRP